jgi:PAS domain S-box-containing protein
MGSDPRPRELALALDALLESAPVGMALLDRELRLVWINEALAGFASRPGRDYRGLKLGGLWPCEAAALEPLALRALEGAPMAQHELPAEGAAPGERRWLLVRCGPVRTDAGVLAGLTVVDITVRKRAEETVAAERARLDTVLRQLPVAAVIVEAPSGRTLVVNPMVGVVMRTEPMFASGLDDYQRYVLLRLDGRPYQLEERPLVRALQKGERVTDEDLWYIAPDGVRLCLRASAAPVIDPQGRIIAAVLTFYDVTDRLRGEEELREREERLRLLVEDVKDYGIYMLDPQGHVASWNKGAERITGYRAEEVIGRSQTAFYPQEDVLLGKADRFLRVTVERGRFEEEGWRLRKDGSRFWANVTFTAMRDPNGRLRGFSSIVHDITERKLIEEALRESNRRIAITLESISDGFCALDRDWRFTFVNPEAERLLRRRRTELIGRRFLDVFPRLRDTAFHREFARAFADGVALDFEQPHGATWFDVRAYPSGIGLSIYFRDVTHLHGVKSAQQVLAATGKQLAESLDYEQTIEQVVRMAVPDLADWCVAVVGDGSRPEHFTLAHEDPTEQARGRELLLELQPRLRASAGISRVLRAGEPELCVDLPDGWPGAIARDEDERERLEHLELVSAMAVPLRARGRTLGALAFLGARRRCRYRPTDLSLAEEVGRRAALAVDNARLYREAQAAIRAREDVVSVATHDLRGPIGALKLRTELLLRKLGQGAPPEALAEGLADLDRQIERLKQLVVFFLEASRATSGQLDLDLEAVDLAQLVRESVARFQDRCDQTGSRVEVRAEESRVGRWDRRRLEQVVNNLLSNALKFGRGKPIEISVDGDADVARFEVRDHGGGIAAEEQEKIFERFQQGAGATTGVGLGLYIVRRIVEALGGAIGVESRLGAGATFRVQLPRAGPCP